MNSIAHAAATVLALNALRRPRDLHAARPVRRPPSASPAPSGTSARELLTTVARSGQVIASYRHARLGDTVLVVSPEHAHVIAGDGWSKPDVQQFLWEHTRAEVDGEAVPKFRDPANITIVVAGSTAGRFSAWIPGWPFPDSPARLIVRKIPVTGRE